MTTTKLADLQDQVQEYWSPIFMKELRAKLLLGTLVNREYEGEIKKGGDEVTVSQINAPEGQNLDAQTDDSFASQKLTTQKIKIKASKRAVSAVEFHDIAEIQSLIDGGNPEVRDSLLYAVREQVNNYLYSLVSPSSSAPAHDLSSVTDMDLAQLSAIRILAAQAKWARDKGWFALLDPEYYGDVTDDTTLASADYGATDAPTISGQLALPRKGFNILEDDSRSSNYGLFFHPDFMHLVMQTAPTFKISDLHAQKRFGYVMSVDMIYGAKLGIDGDVKHIKVTN